MVEYNTAEEAAAAQEKLLEEYKGELPWSVLARAGGSLTLSNLRKSMPTVRQAYEEYKTLFPPHTPEVLDEFEALEKTRLALLEKGLSGEAQENTSGSGRAYATSTLVGVGPMDQLFAAIEEGVNIVREWWRKSQSDSPSNEIAQAEPDLLAPTPVVPEKKLSTQYNAATNDDRSGYNYYTTIGGGVDLSGLNAQPQIPEPSRPSATQIIEARFGPFSP